MQVTGISFLPHHHVKGMPQNLHPASKGTAVSSTLLESRAEFFQGGVLRAQLCPCLLSPPACSAHVGQPTALTCVLRWRRLRLPLSFLSQVLPAAANLPRLLRDDHCNPIYFLIRVTKMLPILLGLVVALVAIVVVLRKKSAAVQEDAAEEQQVEQLAIT